MNILLVDDHPMLCEGIALFLQGAFADVQVFQATNAAEALVVVQQQPINLVFLDIQFSPNGLEGLEILTQLKQSFADICVVFFSGLVSQSLVFDALKKGAMGFIPKTLPRQQFTDALKDVLSGRPYVPACVLGVANDNIPPPLVGAPRLITQAAELGLSPKQFELLRCAVQHGSNKHIAKKLGKAEQTVKNQLRPIYERFNVKSRVELIVAVAKAGIILGEPEASSSVDDPLNADEALRE